MAQSALNAIGQVGIPAIQARDEQILKEPRKLVRNTLLGQRGDILLEGNLYVTYLPPCRSGDFLDRLGKGQEAGPGQFVELTRMPVLRKCRNRNFRDVLGVNKRLPDVASGEDYFATAY